MKKILLLTALLALGSLVAQAGTTVLDFTGLQDTEQVLNYYNGGFGGYFSGPGPNYGITFGPTATVLVSAAAGGSGQFDGGPSKTALYFASSTGDVMDVTGGFTTAFSLFYSSPFDSATATIYSGLDGTGSVLATLTLPESPDGLTNGAPCSGNYDFCPWEAAGVSFSGTADSVVFSGPVNQYALENLTLGSATPHVPEPATLAMLASGLLGLAGLRRKFIA
jgi:PEP-CTERM motif